MNLEQLRRASQLSDRRSAIATAMRDLKQYPSHLQVTVGDIRLSPVGGFRQELAHQATRLADLASELLQEQINIIDEQLATLGVSLNSENAKPMPGGWI